MWKFLEAKIKSYSDDATDFHANKIPEEGSTYIYCSVTLTDSVL